MFRHWTPFFFAPGDAAGSGGAGADTTGAAGAGGDAGSDDHSDGNGGPDDAGEAGAGDDAGDDDQARGAAGTDDDDDDEDAGLSPEVRDDPKRLRTHRRRLQRQLSAVRPIAERFRGPDGKFLDARQVDTIVSRARDMEEFEQLFEQHPDLLQEIIARKRGGAKGKPAAAAAAAGDEFDESALPFETESKQGKFFANMARQLHDSQRLTRQLSEQLTQFQRTDTTRTVAQIETTWKTATLKAAEQVPEVSRRTFVNAVHRAFELAKVRGQLGRANVQRILEQELEPYVRANRGKARQDAAGAQRRAEHSTTVPRPGNRGQTTAASPSATNKVGTIRDGRKSFFERQGMTPPPR